jgi:hypothetical protein
MKNALFLIFFAVVSLQAQINEGDTLDVKADLSLTGVLQGGNVDALIFRANSNVSMIPLDQWVFKTQNSYVYQEFGNEKADEDILSLNFLYFKPDSKMHPLLLGFISTNFRRQIDVRYLFGLGMTYQLINEKKDWLKISVTNEYERTRFAQTDFNHSSYDGQATINTLRGTLWVNGRYQLFNNKMILSHESYFQPSLSQGNNYRWQADIALELPVWQYFNFRINYLHTFESLVIEDQKQEDRFLTFGFTLKNY